MSKNKKKTKEKNNKKDSKKTITKKGVVKKALPNASFRVETEDGKEILATVAGKLRMYKIKILPGDKVRVEMSPYDEERGRITYRL